MNRITFPILTLAFSLAPFSAGLPNRSRRQATMTPPNSRLYRTNKSATYATCGRVSGTEQRRFV